MKILNLLKNVETVSVQGNTKTEISSICFDSRKATKNCLFVAIKGEKTDGHQFIDYALGKGAKAIVYEKMPKERIPGVVYIKTKDSHLALSLIAQNFYGNPSQKLKLVGVTGTNGKTTTATMLFNMFRLLGFHTALLSTIENKIDNKKYEATHTTPDPIELASFLSIAVSKGCKYAFMECSSHAIHQKRIGGLRFAGTIFTNLTHDHLDYHKTFSSYAKAKKMLFDSLSEKSFAITNSDDKYGKYMVEDTKAHKHFISYKGKTDADFSGHIISQTLDGLMIKINKDEIKTKLTGTFNAYNIAGIYATALLLGIKKNKVIGILQKLDPPSGRLQFYKSKKGIFGVVDYAHTPDALENVLRTIREIEPKSKIITVVGCGGDRDKTKRPVMGRISTKMSDYTIFTSDNPRFEKPESIIDDIVAGLSENTKNFERDADRKKAIKIACKLAKPGDIILLAGKGHEEYQVLEEYTEHLSDMEELKNNLKI